MTRRRNAALATSGSAAALGRNSPCPCGSGRKFKHCCARKRNGLPLVSRLSLLALAVILFGGLIYFVASLDEFATPSAGPQRVWSEAHQHWH
jgi:hypothetical protein